MEQEKIGKFIAKLRKEKRLTQQELAEKLGITDRAISKWENGRGLPDLSLLMPLCKELNISINELLSGEYLKEENYNEKLEENIIKTIDYSNKKIKKNKNRFIIVLGSIIIFIILLISMFSVDVRQMRNNKPVIFSNWGFDYVPPVDLSSEEIESAIKDFLIKKNESESKHYNNEKWFVSMKTYLIEEKEGNIFNIYTWVLAESYYLKNHKPILDSGSSIPHKFVVKKENNKFIVDSYQIPRDGSLYVKDMKDMFPKYVLDKMDLVHRDGTIEKLSLDIKEQVNLYFHLS